MKKFRVGDIVVCNTPQGHQFATIVNSWTASNSYTVRFAGPPSPEILVSADNMYDVDPSIFANKEALIGILNSAWATLPPVKYAEFNFTIVAKDVPKLLEVEKEHDEVGVAEFAGDLIGMTTLSFIATITDLLCGERLAAVLDDGIITKWTWAEYAAASIIEDKKR